MKMPSAAVPVLLALAGLTLLPGCMSVRAYDGRALPKSQVVRVFNTPEVQVVAIDDRVIESKINSFQHTSREELRYEIAPGDHRITVRYVKSEGYHYRGMLEQYEAMLYSPVMISLRHAFEPGKEYTFVTKTLMVPRTVRDAPPEEMVPTGAWTVMLAEKASGAVVAAPETGPSPTRPGAAATAATAGSAGAGATVAGRGIFRIADGSIWNVTGRDILLMPKTPETEKFVYERMNDIRHWTLAHGMWSAEEPPVAKRQGRRVLGYGDGYFEFTNVPPGTYLLLVDHRHGPFDPLRAWAEVTVAPGQQRVDGVTLNPTMKR